MEKLICPWCGEAVHVRRYAILRFGKKKFLSEEEPVPKSAFTGYVLQHVYAGKSCPIAHREGEMLGHSIYATKEGAIKEWTGRKEFTA